MTSKDYAFTTIASLLNWNSDASGSDFVKRMSDKGSPENTSSGITQTTSRALMTILSSFYEHLYPQRVPENLKSPSDLLAVLGKDLDSKSWSLIQSAQSGARLVENTPVEEHVSYHNHKHFSEAIASVTMLAHHEFAPSQVYEKLVALNAMIFHDLGHDGGTNTLVPLVKESGVKEVKEGEPQRLEKLAFSLAQPVLDQEKVTHSDQRLLQEIILNTDPARTMGTKKEYASLPPVAHEHSFEQLTTRISALCNDADVLFSLLPQTGLDLGKKLSEEWSHIDHPQAKSVSSFSGRLGFLRFFAPMSDAAKSCELAGAVEAQIKAFESFAQKKEEVADAEKSDRAALGAQYLDGFPVNLSKRQYLQRLGSQINCPETPVIKEGLPVRKIV